MFFYLRFHRYSVPLGILVAGFLVAVFGASPVAAAVKSGDVRRTYTQFFDRAPTAEEIAAWNGPKAKMADLVKKLNDAPERDRALVALYRQALNRRPRPHEIAAWKTGQTSLPVIRQALFGSEERRSGVADIYLGLLGRYPRDDEYAFFNQRFVSLEKIREWLAHTEGRRVTVIKRFEQVLGRAPDETELAYFITSGQDLDFVGRNSAPIANAGEDQTVSNDVDFVELDGTKSTDLEQDALSYTWSVIETPPETSVTLSDIHIARPTFRVPASPADPLYQFPGVYRFHLVTSDGQSASAPDEVVITVLPETAFERQLLDVVNTLRSVEGEGKAQPFVLNPQLTRAARKYSRYLFVNGWFESIDRDGKTPADRVRGEGYVARRVGENIALIKSKTSMRITKKRVQDMYDGWYASAEHKKNLLKLDVVDVGIGFFGGEYAPGDYRLYAVQLFAVPQPKKEEVKKDASPIIQPAQPSNTAASAITDKKLGN